MCYLANSCRAFADRKSFLIFLTLPLRFRFLNRTSNKPWDGFETRISNVVISAISYFIRVPLSWLWLLTAPRNTPGFLKALQTKRSPIAVPRVWRMRELVEQLPSERYPAGSRERC